MQDRKIYLIRHGESRDGELTPVGEVQAVHAAERFLKDVNNRSVITYCSPLQRARMTGAIFTRRTGIPTRVDPRLHVVTFHDLNAQSAFADQFVKCQAKNIVLIGHDENRAHLAFIAMRLFSYRPDTTEVPLGGLLCVDGARNIRLLS